jgi:hypothetical protein
MMKDTVMVVEYQSDMLREVREGLNRARGGWRGICGELDISYHWLAKVAQGQISNPGVNEIERLHKYLSAKYPRKVA